MDSFIIDEKTLKIRLKEIILESKSEILIIECHSITSLPRNLIDQIILLKASTSVHFDRLTKRGYSNQKIQENIDCEIMQVILEDVINRFPNIPLEVFDNHTQEDAVKIVNYLSSLIK
jgi:adenylate kinase